MKLSEAIVLSIGAVRNYRASWMKYDGDILCGCLVTTALFSIGKLDDAEQGSKALHTYWPWTARPGTDFGINSPCPFAMILSGYHYAGQSREALADFVATIEPQEVSEAVLVEASTLEVN